MDYKLDDVVNHRVSILAIIMKRQILRILSARGLEITPDQWVILYYLWQENGLSIGEIAKRSRKDLANVTRIVDKLVKLKYVSKKRSKSDSRISNVFILPKGEDIKFDVQQCWKHASGIALKGISDQEQIQFMQTLEKIEKNIIDDLNM